LRKKLSSVPPRASRSSVTRTSGTAPAGHGGLGGTAGSG
jgi:hypothetical protein